MSTYTKSVTVFCGSHAGNNPSYSQAAKDLAAEFVNHKIRLVFGGGNVGIMGIISNTMLDLNGSVKGVIPKFLQKKEGQHTRVQDLVITEDMHTRKEILYKEADAFICLSGGVGTFDELFETITWKQLHLHNKPIIIINVQNWADPLYAQIQAIISQGFADPSLLELFKIVPDVKTALEHLTKYFNA